MRGGRGQPLLPLRQARRALARLQEGALQFADVGLVFEHLLRRRGVLREPFNHDTGEVRPGSGAEGTTAMLYVGNGSLHIQPIATTHTHTQKKEALGNLKCSSEKVYDQPVQT